VLGVGEVLDQAQEADAGGHHRPPQAAARRAGLEFVEKRLPVNLTSKLTSTDRASQDTDASRPSGLSEGIGTMTQPTHPHGLLGKVDGVQIPVPDLDGGLAFYRDRLGHELIWRTKTAAGLRLTDSDSELVLQTQQPQLEVDFLVDSVDQAATQLTRAGGTVLVEPFDIPVGRVAVIADPFGNSLTILDLTKGRYLTDADGNVIGVTGADEASTPDEPCT
jgi:predicted enzyme related to lactoylglutathione lyase